MVDPILYHNYRFINVYKKTSDRVCQQIMACWQRNNVFPRMRPAFIEKRARQVVYMILNEQDQVIGVSSVYLAKFPGDGKRYFFYRMFIQPSDRIYGMMKRLTLQTCVFLEEMGHLNQAEGIIIFTENQKLMRPGIKRMFQRNGGEYLGRNPKGEDIWRYSFKCAI